MPKARTKASSPIRTCGLLPRADRAAARSLTDESRRAEAAALVRKLIDNFVLTPVTHEGRETLAIDLHRRLAGILPMAANAKKALTESGFDVDSVKLVRGQDLNLQLRV